MTSKADAVFGPLAGPMVAEWGSSCQYIRVSDPGTYDPTTGLVASTETVFNVKAVMLELEPQEYEGVFQQSDFKLIIDPGQIANGYITTSDRFVVPFPSGNKNCKVIDVVTYRGDKPISFEVVVRPQ